MYTDGHLYTVVYTSQESWGEGACAHISLSHTMFPAAPWLGVLKWNQRISNYLKWNGRIRNFLGWAGPFSAIMWSLCIQQVSWLWTVSWKLIVDWVGVTKRRSRITSIYKCSDFKKTMINTSVESRWKTEWARFVFITVKNCKQEHNCL
jgi:hypothetical protein